MESVALVLTWFCAGADFCSTSAASASTSSMAGPMLPATATRIPARDSNCPVREVVVVLPLVPVMASTLGAKPAFAYTRRKPSANRSSSPSTGTPRAVAQSATTCNCAGDRPGLLHTAAQVCRAISASSKGAQTTAGTPSSPTVWVVTWRAKSSNSVCKRCINSGCKRVSATVTRAPRRTHQRAMAWPEMP
jgi:hypothetical protein